MRFLMIVLVALALFALTACPKPDDGTNQKPDPTAAAEEEGDI